ncbi:hypothetical protein GC089_16805 [Cellulomonas sp. JZ18]|uniref:hypothetical protein n=1 Tax=Cellulomonas sp. JZ18 TaxID=2654191 RepID=UPI0012D498E2|nr:hypothetical protein [Cellulomonas sp. JZ18]QGQ20543.1 hypothetical protein GC089_16805 [Cellulomonas sp. JZ18]
MPRRPGPPSALQLDPTPLPTVHLHGHHPPEDVRRLLATGTWTRVRRGASVDAPGPGRHDRRTALARVVAVHRQSSHPPLLVRESAALVWGLPLAAVPRVTHVAQASHPSDRSAADVVRHVVHVPAEHRTVHRGLHVTTLERTVVDCAATLDPYGGLVVADAALHAGADPDRIGAMLEAARGRRGVRRARAVVAAADGGAESPGETWTRWTLLRFGLPTPETQVAVVTPAGRYWGDLGYPGRRVLVEYDGAEKYGTDAAAAVDALRQERRRQLAVEEAGWRVVRATAADRRDPARLVTRVQSLLPDVRPTPRPDLQPPPRTPTR